jgi:hypothetical protein
VKEVDEKIPKCERKVLGLFDRDITKLSKDSRIKFEELEKSFDSSLETRINFLKVTSQKFT